MLVPSSKQLFGLTGVSASTGAAERGAEVAEEQQGSVDHEAEDSIAEDIHGALLLQLPSFILVCPQVTRRVRSCRRSTGGLRH